MSNLIQTLIDQTTQVCDKIRQGHAMQTPEEYRQQADDYVKLAQTSVTREQRARYLQVAQVIGRLADEAASLGRGAGGSLEGRA